MYHSRPKHFITHHTHTNALTFWTCNMELDVPHITNTLCPCCCSSNSINVRHTSGEQTSHSVLQFKIPLRSWSWMAQIVSEQGGLGFNLWLHMLGYNPTCVNTPQWRWMSQWICFSWNYSDAWALISILPIRSCWRPFRRTQRRSRDSWAKHCAS